jgi:hypothetical protein
MTTNQEAPLVQPLTATVGFTRKTGDYNNTELSLYLPVEIPKVADFDGDLEAYFKKIDDNLRTGFTTAKGLVYEQLGIEYDDVNGIITEKVAAKFPGSQTATAPRAQQPASAPAPAPAGGPVGEFGACPKCGGTEFWDNRPKKTAGEYKSNAPDGKCKNQNCKNGVWLKK